MIFDTAITIKILNRSHLIIWLTIKLYPNKIPTKIETMIAAKRVEYRRWILNRSSIYMSSSNLKISSVEHLNKRANRSAKGRFVKSVYINLLLSIIYSIGL